MRRSFQTAFLATILFITFLGAKPAHAAVEAETAYVLNTLLFLIGGFLVMWMAAGFAMLEAGLVRSKNVAEICLKNITLYSVAGLLYFLVGYNLMYTGVDGGFVGTLNLWAADDQLATAASGGDFSNIETPYAASADWFFQMAFVATAASIVSGTVAERVKLFPFLAFTVILTGFIYPIQGSWEWGQGWLDARGFSDFAGSTLVHAAGGWAALAGAILVGPRRGKYTPAGGVRPMPGSSLPLATLGTFILWMGWFGFNGASQLALGSAVDAASVANIFANTNTAAAAGCIAATFISKVLYQKVDLTMALNGALAGLVSITAEPLTPSLGAAAAIGGVGGILVVFAVPLFDRFKIDDVVGALSVHLVCGIWGTLAVPLTNHDPSVQFSTQLLGVLAIGAFVFTASFAAWYLLKMTVGIRLHAEDEEKGADLAELGLEAYPEFGRGSQKLF